MPDLEDSAYLRLIARRAPAFKLNNTISNTWGEHMRPRRHLVSPGVAKQQVPAMSFSRPKPRVHVKAHKTVISHERWSPKGLPFLGKPFTMKKTVKRQATVIKILSRCTEAGGQGCQRRTRRCLLPGSGRIAGLPPTPELRLISLPRMHTNIPAGRRWRPRKPSSPNSERPPPARTLSCDYYHREA